MFPDVPDKAMWVMAALATVAVLVSRAHADVAVPSRPATVQTCCETDGFTAQASTFQHRC